jgi:hypothetical protein
MKLPDDPQMSLSSRALGSCCRGPSRRSSGPRTGDRSRSRGSAPHAIRPSPLSEPASPLSEPAVLGNQSAARYRICLKLCDRPDCAACSCIQEVLENLKVVAATSTEAYIKDKKLPIAVALDNNSAAWQKFARETLVLEANVCQTHATAIAANNGSHKKFLDDVTKNYEPFYEFVNHITHCSFSSVGEGLQELLVEWLRGVGGWMDGTLRMLKAVQQTVHMINFIMINTSNTLLPISTVSLLDVRAQ